MHYGFLFEIYVKEFERKLLSEDFALRRILCPTDWLHNLVSHPQILSHYLPDDVRSGFDLMFFSQDSAEALDRVNKLVLLVHLLDCSLDFLS